LLTAGHCGEVNSKWGRGNAGIGIISRRQLGGSDDFATISLMNPTAWTPQPWVYTANGPQPVQGGYSVGTAGATVCTRGASSAYNCGQVVSLSSTLTDGHTGIQVNNLIKTTLCTTAGDSGAPITVPNGKGVLGVGLLSGNARTSTGQCQNVTWYEPLDRVLANGSLQLVTGK
jgi:hypothetical protein